jgi:hypothetical protein
MVETKFKYNDKARVKNTNIIVDVIDVVPKINPFNGSITISYEVFSMQKGKGFVQEDRLEKYENE